MTYYFERLTDPAFLVFMIPILGVIGWAVNEALSNYYKHKERMFILESKEREKYEEADSFV